MPQTIRKISRANKGRAIGRIRVSDADVRTIRRMVKTHRPKVIARRFGISESYVSRLRHRSRRVITRAKMMRRRRAL